MTKVFIYLRDFLGMNPYEKAYRKKQKIMYKNFSISWRKRRKIEKCLDELQEHLDDFCVKSERIEIAQKISSLRQLVKRYSIK